jgi:hypothetical protein
MCFCKERSLFVGSSFVLYDRHESNLEMPKLTATCIGRALVTNWLRVRNFFHVFTGTVICIDPILPGYLIMT